MQIINHWPNHELAISKDVQEALCEQLLMPFSNTQEASCFWSQSGTCLIVIEQDDEQSLLTTLEETLTNLISNAVDCYEYKETLAPHY